MGQIILSCLNSLGESWASLFLRASLCTHNSPTSFSLLCVVITTFCTNSLTSVRWTHNCTTTSCFSRPMRAMPKSCASHSLWQTMTLAETRRLISFRMVLRFLSQTLTSIVTSVSSAIINSLKPHYSDCANPLGCFIITPGLVAKHHVCDRVRVQSEAFRRGLWEVIDKSWLRIFNEPELQVLISGPSDGKIDVADMRANSRYAGGYTPIDRNIIRFWKVVGSLSSTQQAALLRFVTSCERPPPLGFSTLNPPFTIQRVGILRDGDKLPTASTCFNVLKLPTYSSEKVLRQRLIYAIESGAGFELT